MADEDYSTGGGSSGRGSGPGKHRGPRFTWNPQFEATFFRSLCESVSLGLRDGSTFKPEAWDRAMQALAEKHNAYANKGHLINKTDNARKKYRLWRGLREDPDFYYNPQTRTVTATDDAWARHLQKEPLARSLRARPFEHEEYYEILFPDVIGSGGAPKRLTKPRRKTTDTLSGTEEPEAPGAAIMDLLTDTAYLNPNQTHMPPPMPPAMPNPMPAPPPQPQQLRGPTNTMPPPPPRTSVSSASALTPPEETALHTRKRLQAPDSTSASNPSQPPDKRRRTAAPGYLDLTQPQHHQQQQPQQQTTINHVPAVPSNASPNATTTATTTTNAGSTLTETLHLLSEVLRPTRGSKPVPGWQEQAMDIFFRDFVAEDMDLQLKIAEKVLTDENKAMVFCKMPDTLRRHWVKRLREVHNRIA
ncbi:hypothetical protein N657DRAFT_622873 [Parathielavia appendiculata]|uniref:Myb/SANT-like domain-containing protein n=1 Tax=Parathielavia appendiculata TaxID=2587402 RepID=A0AAN6TVK8_9PEZI|nr:hypothetical protein N657DRAFT_622873 [Parathielavia appendiculata]